MSKCVDCGLLLRKDVALISPGHHDSSVLRAFRILLMNPYDYQSLYTTGS